MDTALSEAQAALPGKQEAVKQAKNKLAEDEKALKAANKNVEDASPLYGQAAYTIVKAQRQAQKDFDTAQQAKIAADAEVQLRDYAVTVALANCQPPKIRCEDDAVLAAEAVLKPLAEGVEQANKDLASATKMKNVVEGAYNKAVKA